MKCTLMHQDIEVATVILNSSHAIDEIVEVYDEARLPIGTKSYDGKLHKQMLNAWWYNRRIPLSRAGLKDHLERAPFLTPDALQMKSWGLSLSDHYWMNPDDNPLNWNDINFFDNDFSEDVGDLLFGKKYSANLDLMSPDNTSDGWLKKKWKIVNGERVLVKAGSAAFHQEPYNEVIASMIMQRLGIEHIPYHVITENGLPYSVCANFVKRETELVSAWYVMQGFKKANHVSVYEHYITCCEELGIANARTEVNKMIVVDYLMANEDRHQNNFGLLRDVKGLKFIGVAPIFDTGTALWFDQPTHIMGSTRTLNCKPFKKDHEQQLKLVTNFDWLDLNKLDGIGDELAELLTGAIYLDNVRQERVVEIVELRIAKLKNHIENHQSSKDNLEDDVMVNIAYSGKE